jgi:hypothetical protein
MIFLLNPQFEVYLYSEIKNIGNQRFRNLDFFSLTGAGRIFLKKNWGLSSCFESESIS